MTAKLFLVRSDGIQETSWHEVKAALGADPAPEPSLIVALTDGDRHEFYAGDNESVMAMVQPTGALQVQGVGRTYGPAGWAFVEGYTQHL